MNNSKFGKHWESIYSHGDQCNRYPYDSVVTFVHRYRDRTLAPENTCILEVGCGAGNNLWFAAREGFDVYGIDGSPSAIKYAKDRFAEEKLKGEFQIGDFTDLPYPDEMVDLVIDRAAVTCVNFQGAVEATNEIHRVLKPKGKYFTFVFDTDHTSYTPNDSDADGYISEIKNGTMVTVQASCYYDENRLKNLLPASKWKILSQRKVIDTDIVDLSRGTIAYWILALEKV